MATELLITKAGVADAEALTALSITTFVDAFGKDNKKEDMDKYVAEAMSVSKIAEEISNAANIFFLAWYNDELRGYAKMRAIETPEELQYKRPIEIERIYVLQGHHGTGIGAAIMGHCIKFARSKHYDVLWLGVWERNHKAVDFYKRWGFELFGSHPFLLGKDWQTDVLMKKEL